MANQEKHIEAILNHLLETIDDDPKARPLGVVVTILREDGAVREIHEVHTILRRERPDARMIVLERSVEMLKDLIKMENDKADES